MKSTSAVLLFALAAVPHLACKSSKDSPTTSAEPEPALPAASHVIEAPTGEPDPGASLRPEQVAQLGGLDRFISDEYLEAVLERPPSENWYGFYMAGQKAGYAQLNARKSQEEEPGRFVVELIVFLKADGQDMRMSELTFFAGPPGYEAIEIRSQEHADSASVKRRFVRDGDKTRVETVIDGKESAIAWAPPMCSSLRSHLATFAPDLSRLDTTSHASYCLFSSGEQKQEIGEMRVAAIDTQQIGGVPLRVATLEVREGDDPTWATARVTEKGTPLLLGFGTGLELKLQEKQLAQSSIDGIDIFDTVVKVATKLGDPSAIKELKVRAHFAEGYSPPASTPNQQIEKRGDNSYDITMRSVPGAKVLPEERPAALVSVGDIDADHPTIVAQARELTKDTKTVRGKVEALNRWIYRNLDKSLSTNLSTASQVLAHKTGDCTEHTVLLVALLRALKIPARELSGLVYTNDAMAAFGWHAWAEVEIDGHWVQVDPSWDELVGNATHINLGDDSVINIGSMQLEIL